MTNRHKYNIKKWMFMKIVKYFFCYMFLFLLCSCHTVIGNWLKKYSKHQLTFGEENAHLGRFRVDGCYIGNVENLDSVHGWGYVFYPDGICVDFCFDENKKNNGRIDFANSLEKKNIYPRQWHSSFMGVYEVRNDTIYCEMYRWGDLLHISTQLWGYKFAIKDSCTLESDKHGGRKFHLVPCENMLYPRTKFVKDRKWIWKTNEDWLKYKKSKKKKK